MSKTISERTKELEEREARLKLEMASSSEELKGKAKRVGKIALVSGLVALTGYWIYDTFINDDIEEEKPKKKRKNKKSESGIWSRLSTVAAPYITNLLEEMLETKELKDSEKEESSNS